MVQEMNHEDFKHIENIKKGLIVVAVLSEAGSVYSTLYVVFEFPFYCREHPQKETLLCEAKETFFRQLRVVIKECRKNV